MKKIVLNAGPLFEKVPIGPLSFPLTEEDVLPAKERFAGINVHRIIGPPGTGKTTTLTKMTGELLGKYKPEDIRCISFSNSSVDTLKERLPSKLDKGRMQTFHSWGNALANKDSKKGSGGSGEANFAWKQVCLFHGVGPVEGYKNYKSPDLYMKCIINENYSRSKYTTQSPLYGFNWKTFEYIFHLMESMSARITLSNDYMKEYIAENFNQPNLFDKWLTEDKEYDKFLDRLKHYMSAIVSIKKDRKFLTFNDMLHSFVLSKKRGLFEKFKCEKVIVVDECQDLSKLQWVVLDYITKHSKPELLVLAGDDDQAIYEFNGVDPRDFIEVTTKKETKLDISYRLPQSIIDYSLNFAEKEIPYRLNKKVKSGLKRRGSIKDNYNVAGYCSLLNYKIRKSGRPVYILCRMNRICKDWKHKLKDLGYHPLIVPTRRDEKYYIGELEEFTRYYLSVWAHGEHKFNIRHFSKRRKGLIKLITGKTFKQMKDNKEFKKKWEPLVGKGFLLPKDRVNLEDIHPIYIMTYHQSKGDECDYTLLDTDGANLDIDGRCLYVAMTRCKRGLLISNGGEYEDDD